MEDYQKIRWVLPGDDRPEVAKLAESIVQARGVDPDSFFNLDYKNLGDPYLLADMEKAVSHLLAVRDRGGKVAIYGDYDIDGLTATSLLLDALTSFGFDVISYIPDRFEEGYGLHTPALEYLHGQRIDTVVTVDCGISAVKPIRAAAALGLHVIVTDHHTVPDIEPEGAVALINPLRTTSTYPERSLAGVGVAFALVRALQAQDPDSLPVGQEKWLLDLVALGTVCDVVPLTGENRLLASYGIQVARKSRRPAFRALAEVSKVDLVRLVASDFGFRFGPRLNAAGRLEHAATALELLTSQSFVEAQASASRLDELNMERRSTTEAIQAEVFAAAEHYVDDAILVLSSPDWSHGVVGLVASRAAEQFGKPTIILQEEGEFSKGSARSVGDFSIIDALRNCEYLFEKFGGHKAAAGMTLRTEAIQELRIALNNYANDELRKLMQREVRADVMLSEAFISLDGLTQLESLEPTGQANPAPIFYYRGVLDSMKLVGKQSDHAQIGFKVDGTVQRAIAFQAPSKWPFLSQGVEVELLLSIRENEWQGVRRAQLEVLQAREYEVDE